jgi:hypothetical protein
MKLRSRWRATQLSGDSFYGTYDLPFVWHGMRQSRNVLVQRPQRAEHRHPRRVATLCGDEKGPIAHSKGAEVSKRSEAPGIFRAAFREKRGSEAGGLALLAESGVRTEIEEGPQASLKMKKAGEKSPAVKAQYYTQRVYTS